MEEIMIALQEDLARLVPNAHYAIAAKNPISEIDPLFLKAAVERMTEMGHEASSWPLHQRPDGIEGGVTTSSATDAIDISIGASDVVNLRGLTLVGGGVGSDGSSSTISVPRRDHRQLQRQLHPGQRQ